MKKFYLMAAFAFAALTMNAEIKEMTCAEAAAAALELGENETGTDSVAVIGYITNTNGEISRKQQTFYMDDAKGSGLKTFQAYWANVPDPEKPLNVGDKVILKGLLLHYVSSSGSHQAEIKNGDVVVLESVEVSFDTIPVDACEAIEEGLALNNDEYTEDYFAVTGIVANQPTFNSYSQTTFNLECETATAIFKAYNCAYTDSIALGDEVLVTGKLYNYNGTIEIKNGKVEFLAAGGVVIDTIPVNVSEAVAVGKALDKGAETKEVYVITGYVDSIQSAWSETYGNISFYMTDDMAVHNYDFLAYRVKCDAETAAKIVPGTKVSVTAGIQRYYKEATDELPEKDLVETTSGGILELSTLSAVENVTTTIINDNKRYNLLGTVVDEQYNGVVIMNGKKFIQ